MVKVLTLLQRLGTEERRFRITQPTNIGREPTRQWVVEDRAPHTVFDSPEEIEVLIKVEGTRYLSRNHAFITPSLESFEITDLNSQNGTSVNGEKISQRRRLAVNDKVNFGTNLELKVESIETPREETETFALLIGYYQDGKEIVKADLASMERTLKLRRYPLGRIQVLEGEAATKVNIQRKLERIARESTSLGHTIVYFSGHGAYNGISVHGSEGERRITQAEMYGWLRSIRGSKALLLDCCRSGSFLDSKYRNLIPSETTILCATGREEFAKEIDVGQGKQGKFTAGVVRYLERNPQRINIRELAERITAQELGIYQGTDPEPRGEGESFILRTRVPGESE